MIPHSLPFLGIEEEHAVLEVLKSRHLAMGDKVRQVEREWSHLTGSESAAMVSSGLSALCLALLSLGVQEGDEVIVSGLSCVALHNSVLSIGAVPILADIELNTLTIDPTDAQKRVTDRTKAIIAVHLFGVHADIQALKFLGIPIIEDMAHGLFRLQGDLAISSFYPTKIVAASKGGIVSGSKELIEKVKDLRYYGDKSPGLRLNEVGTDLDAAIVLEQLKKLDDNLLIRLAAGAHYSSLLPWHQKHLRVPLYDGDSIIYRYVIRLKNHNAAEVSEKMKIKDIYCEMPVWDYRHTVDWPDDLPNTDQAFSQCLSLPLYPDITREEQNQVVKALGGVLNGI